MAATTLLLQPSDFFSDESHLGDAVTPAAIVSLTALVSLVGPGFVFYRILEKFSARGAPLVVLGGLMSFIGSAFAIFLLWIVYAGVFYLISSYYSEAVDFRQVLAVVGWGFLPSLLSACFLSVTTLLVFSTVSLPDDPELLRPFIRTLRQRAPFLVARSVSLLFSFWQGYLWMQGIRRVYRFDIKRSTLVVAGPVFLTVVLKFNSML